MGPKEWPASNSGCFKQTDFFKKPKDNVTVTGLA